MAQMAAQDYFSRIQMSGMMHPDLANFSALGGLNSLQNNPSMGSNSSGGNKPNLKRKDKGSAHTQQDYNKMTTAKEVWTNFCALDDLLTVLIRFLEVENTKHERFIPAKCFEFTKRTLSDVSCSSSLSVFK